MIANEDDLKEFERQWVDGEKWIGESLREREGVSTNFFTLLTNGRQQMPTGITIRLYDWDNDRDGVVGVFFLVGLKSDPFAVRRKLWELLGRLRGISKTNE